MRGCYAARSSVNREISCRFDLARSAPARRAQETNRSRGLTLAGSEAAATSSRTNWLALDAVRRLIPQAGQPVHYDIHAWVWKANPAGELSDFNPTFAVRPRAARSDCMRATSSGAATRAQHEREPACKFLPGHIPRGFLRT